MNDIIKKFGQAVQYLPPRFREDAMVLDDNTKISVTEFRLRSGRKLRINNGVKETEISESVVRHEEIRTVLELATKSSVHTSYASLCEGYITVAGGHRISVCGTAIRDGDSIKGFRDLSSVSIRIAKEIKDASEEIINHIFCEEVFCNTLIVSPPGHGKTTTLRDLIRRISDRGIRISLVDEKGEVAAKHKGCAQFDIGECTDVIDGVDKANGAVMMLRAMTPDIIALDEITAQKDIDAVCSVFNCGVGILATAHGYTAEDIFLRPGYKKLKELGVFKKIVFLNREKGNYSYTVSNVTI